MRHGGLAALLGNDDDLPSAHAILTLAPPLLHSPSPAVEATLPSSSMLMTATTPGPRSPHSGFNSRANLLFNGLRVRLGVSTGFLQAGVPIRSSPIFEAAKRESLLPGSGCSYGVLSGLDSCCGAFCFWGVWGGRGSKGVQRFNLAWMHWSSNSHAQVLNRQNYRDPHLHAYCTRCTCLRSGGGRGRRRPGAAVWCHLRRHQGQAAGAGGGGPQRPQRGWCDVTRTAAAAAARLRKRFAHGMVRIRQGMVSAVWHPRPSSFTLLLLPRCTTCTTWSPPGGPGCAGGRRTATSALSSWTCGCEGTDGSRGYGCELILCKGGPAI